MNPYYTIALVGFLVILAVLLVRFVNRTVDEQFRGLARAADDEAFRKERIARLDERLAGMLPLSADAAPLSVPRKPGLIAALPPVLTLVGVVLLWGGGGGATEESRARWLYAGIGSLCVASLIMLATLRRRKWAQTARLLLFRADLKRMDGDRAGAAADLRELLLLTPWDDAAWAELSDDLAVQGELAKALEAMSRAGEIDPAYDEYHMLQASLAIRLKDFPRARAAIAGWREAGGVDAEDPRVTIYQAALDLAEGRRDAAEAAIKSMRLDEESTREFLDADQALADVLAIFPGTRDEGHNYSGLSNY